VCRTLRTKICRTICPHSVQSTFSEDRAETTKCFVLGENRTKDLWLVILWLKYNEFIPEVREQLEAATRAVAQGNGKTDLDMYLSIVDAEAGKAEEAYNTWSTDPAAAALRKKIDNIKQSKEMLSVKELPSYTNAIAGPSRAPRG